ncbi:MAG: type II secretion system protein [Chthoniobacter sp.]|nr:type II secretion system protein [Chthoniobacter sp.]
MNSSLTKLRTSAQGFTLVEMMVSAALVGSVGLMILSVLVGTMTLSSQNVVTNLSNYRARQTLDRIGQVARYAADTPVLINADGTTATGTSDGILMKNALGGPYVFKNSDGTTADIPSGATTFAVQYAPSAGADTPKVGDYFLLNLSTAPELEVASVGAVTGGSVAQVVITTKTGITETATPSTYTVTASRYRKEAYVFAQAGTQWTLRHYGRVTSAMSYSNPASFTVLGMGFQKLGTLAWFTTTLDNGTQATWLHAVARSSDHGEYAESVAGHNTLTTMPVQIKLWNYNAPPPAS